MQRSIEISCEHVWREISNYLDGDVDPDLRARMQAHFKVCSHCTAVLDGARNVVRLVADGRAFDLPRGFSERLRHRIAAKVADK
ncbi:MAG: anti-sigma factor family protein [Chlamydiota bacterium]